MSTTTYHTQQVKAFARQLGFDYCGIAKAVKLDEDARRLEAWLNRGMHGAMQYMANHFELRIDPRKLVPGARSVITLLANYFPAEQQRPDAPQISKYAYGNDYHDIIRKKLNRFLMMIGEHIGEVQGRGFVDSAPVLERTWANRSGLGWVGRNGNLITKGQGSFLFIATLITDLELVCDEPFTGDYCGTCTRCIDQCPTEAILPGKIVDGSKCISYFTIEYREQLPEEYREKFRDWIFGCDICQDVCPWNRFSRPAEGPEFKAIPEILNFSTGEWDHLNEDVFRELFRNSPIRRTKYTGLMRNLRFIQRQEGRD